MKLKVYPTHKKVVGIKICPQTGKMGFTETSVELALKSLSHAKRKYKCEFCHYWHTTSRD